jgi:spore germination protein
MKIKILMVHFFLLFLLTGCWDHTEIENIGFVMGIAIDPVKEEEEKEEKVEKESEQQIGKHLHEQMFRLTFQLAIPKGLDQSGGEGGGTKTHHNITSTGMTNFKIYRNVSSRSSRRLNAEHLKVIIINEKLAREGMLEHLTDFYLRDHEMRRRTYILVSKGDARDVLENSIPLENMTALYIRETSDNYNAVLQMPKYLEMGDLSTYIIKKQSFVVPRVISGEKDLKIAGGAIFDGKSNKMIGWLGEEETQGYNLIIGEAKNGVLEVEFENEASFVFESFSMNSSINYVRKEEKNVFDVEIRLEGTFGENWIHRIDINDQKTLQKLEDAVEKKIKEQATSVIQKMQNEFYADIFEFGKQVKQKEYQYWQKIKNDWDGKDGKFQSAEINVTAKVEIRHFMTEEKLE